jgi:ArsR family transcriptional regulator
MIKSHSAQSQPAALLGWMDNLADETRLRLLHLLEQHELGVVELCDILQLPQSTVSRHLKILADQKWVRSRRLATTHLYRTILDELDAAARSLWLLARQQTANWATLQQDELRLQRRLKEREIDSQEFFAGAAAEWDRLRNELYGDDFTTSALLTLIPRDLVVADLGCGSGPVIDRLVPQVKRVIGVDISSAMLKAAKKRLGSHSNVELRKGDLSSLPIEDSAVDVSLLLLVLTYVADVPAVLREATRISKPGARVVVVDLLPHDREEFRRELGQLQLGFDPDQMKRMLSDAGFQRPTCGALPPAPLAKGPALFLATAQK